MWRVNWRGAFGPLLGLLLALPLFWLLQLIFQPPQEGRLSPLLTSEERKSLLTYGRRCSATEPCEPPLGCLHHTGRGRRYCTDSACITDAQCPEGHSCRGRPTLHGPWVRRCIALGVRAEGEGCYAFPDDQDEACAPGLICAGAGWCGRPCGKDASCPEGYFCSEKEPEPACLPTCEKRGCPAGQECIRSDGDGASTCAVVYGRNCQQTPCPAGQFCLTGLVPERPGQAWVRCGQECYRPTDASCPEGTLCYHLHCERLCTPEQPDTCGEGYTCAQGLDTPAWVCLPEWYHLYRR
jgi:hypothetical protein